MAYKSGSDNKPSNTRSRDIEDKDRTIAGLKDRIADLEKELRSCREKAGPIDVAERKRAEDALRAGEESYRSLVESAGDWVWETDEDFVLTYDSPRGREVMGYGPEEVIGKNPFCFMPKDELERIKLIAGPAIARHEPIQRLENRLIKNDGSLVTIETTAIPLYDESGRYRGYRGVNHDITDRKRAEEALRLTQFALDNFGESAIWITKDGRITYVNQAACRSLGYSREELLSMHISDIDPNYPGEKLRKLWSVRRRDRYTKFESTHVARDGRAFPVEVTSSYIRYGDEEFLVTFDRDINERKQAEEALHESERRYRGIVEDQTELICLFAMDSMITFVNDAYCRYFGKTREELVGHSFLTLVSEQDQRVVKADIAGLSEKNPAVSIEQRVKRPDGSLSWMEWKNRIVFDKHGRPTGYQSVGRDITDRKRAEEEMIAAKQQSELYLDLMGHDINNLHQVALGYLELASAMPPGEEQAKLLEKPVEVLQRSTQLIQNVRKLQKLQEGVFLTQVVGICEVLRDVQREFGAVPNKAVTLNVNRCDQCLVNANELLHDVFANLVSNAIKHTGDRADIVIDMDVEKESGRKYCRIMVEDNGPGIPDDFKGRIFNRMLKGTTKAKGMGLGLYLVKSLVNSYDGKVWVEDRVQGDFTKGARFVVMLPAVEK
jgi:PAS domain S-box-containing protein